MKKEQVDAMTLQEACDYGLIDEVIEKHK